LLPTESLHSTERGGLGAAKPAPGADHQGVAERRGVWRMHRMQTMSPTAIANDVGVDGDEFPFVRVDYQSPTMREIYETARAAAKSDALCGSNCSM
jgi:hypothetical protein